LGDRARADPAGVCLTHVRRPAQGNQQQRPGRDAGPLLSPLGHVPGETGRRPAAADEMSTANVQDGT
ncbi:MAG TPA: hypothetical protein VFH48_20730, partial [Chloroflexota bacterium]|nr:hypothetical protein [Chloroflexota bacterium]